MKKLILSILMLGVMLVALGNVSAVISLCGDGVITPGEACDNGEANHPVGSMDPVWDLIGGQGDRTYCSDVCETFFVPGTWCGDNSLQEQFEECDDGNNEDGDGCSSICEVESCDLTINTPEEGDWFDSEAVPIEWSLDGNYCTPIDVFYLLYEKDGTCDPDTGDWAYIPGTEGGLTQSQVGDVSPYNYLWDRPSESGQYCLKIKVTSNGARDVSGVWNVDLTPPEVSLSVGDPKQGDCAEETTGDCYINQDTEITLDCTDNNPDEPWQSGVDYIEYRYQINDGDWTSWEEYEGPFTFPQDSNHVLEYRCFDNVGKHDDESKAFIVDTVGPEFVSKTVGNPKISGCDEIIGESECDWYVTKDTEICLEYSDPEPHPVGGVNIFCETFWWFENPQEEPNDVFEIELDEYGCFKYEEDSYHMLHCWAEDGLGNRQGAEDLYEGDIVDTEAPVTTIDFEGPHYTEGCFAEWINTVSRIVLTAEDPEPHPVGGVTTYYRYGVLPDEYCYGDAYEEDYSEDVEWEQDWAEYEESFGLPESCHVIEYYSTDALGNTEKTQSRFVFSDHTAPETNKVVGEPSAEVDYEPCGIGMKMKDRILNGK